MDFSSSLRRTRKLGYCVKDFTDVKLATRDMAKLKETTLPAKRCSVLRLTQEDDKILSRKVANLVFLSWGIKNAWRIEWHKKKTDHRRRNVLRLFSINEIASFD